VLVWRDHYVAALFAGDRAVAKHLEDKGFEVVRMGTDSTAWAEPTAVLAKLLGRET
jgi:hypothetical protein